jgi:hypothetical protein
VVALDRVRQRRQGEPLIAGTISNGLAQPMVARAASSNTLALPPTEGVPAAATAWIETLALEAEAGAVVRALLAASGAHRLYRVVGWPAGAVAIDDTVYVNAAWLVSLAPDTGEKADGGSVAESSGGPGADVSRSAGQIASLNTEVATAGATSAPAISNRPSVAILRGSQFDAGAPSSPSENANPEDACSACADACAASSGDTGEYSDDSCDSSDDSADDGGDACNSTADDGGNSCGAAADDSGEAANCQVSRGGGHRKSGTLVWLFSPLVFLLSRRQS